jgi:hypothetical protein
VFVGGVLCTQSALGMGHSLLGVRPVSVCNHRCGPLRFTVQYVTYDVRTLRSRSMEEKKERFEMRVPASFLKTIDDWRRKQPELPSRAEAIRRLVELGLKVWK